MKKWWIVIALTSILSAAIVSYAAMSEARSQELKELVSLFTGGQRITAGQMVAEPPLFPRFSPRTWSFTVDHDQANYFRNQCNINAERFPSPDEERARTGCVVAHYFDTVRYRYIVITFNNDIVNLISSEMSQLEFEELVANGQHAVSEVNTN